MELVKTISEVKDKINSWRKKGLKIALVPTMGYLHSGHASLIEKARKENDKVVVSVFVNPIQFGPNEDLDSYPRDIEHDSMLCEKFGADLIFSPEVEEMYPTGAYTTVMVKDLTNNLCGAKRPGHFNGVCTVVSKLFNIVTPDRAYFGEKDAQQLAVIKRFVKDLNFTLEIVGCPIVREADGLAMSSRNTYLSKEERKAALVLSKSLNNAKSLLQNGEKNAKTIRDMIIKEISSEPLAKYDYVEIVDSLTIQPVENFVDETLVAIAVFIGETRLIDNFTWRH